MTLKPNFADLKPVLPCITPEQVMALDSDVRALIIVNPSNPTGSIISPTDYEQIINICLERNITVISDEIYQNIVFDGAKPVETALRHSHDLIIINSFSKCLYSRKKF